MYLPSFYVGEDRPRGDLDRRTVAEATDLKRFEAARNIIPSGRGIAKNPYAASGSRPDVRRMGTHDPGGKKVMASGRAQLFQPRRRKAWK